ncbi:MAG: hypothetical protein KGI37_06720 [Alphaproteobacteria bacterium]|nr:hypothetical protein [Alphaproteobacteria bacterium]
MTSEDKIAKALKEAEVVPSHKGGGNDTDSGGFDPRDHCPVTALGMNDGNCFFVGRSGEVRKLAHRDFTEACLITLFGNKDWLCQNFPNKTKKGGKDFSSFNRSEAMNWLIDKCDKKGLYDQSTPLRGAGVWRADNDPVLHSGDGIWYKNQWLPPGQKIHGSIYTARAALKRPDFKAPMTAIEALEVRKWLDAWAFDDPIEADLLFGFLGAALLGGFPLWRVHVFIIGERGIGKTTLGDLLIALLGEQGLEFNDFTEAGLRQSLLNEARTISLDEGEPGKDGSEAHRMSSVIRLLRKLSGGQGARIARGSSSGVAQNYTVTGSVLLLAINPPPLEPQDRSRILQVGLRKSENPVPKKIVEGYVREAARRSLKIRARAILGADRFAYAVEFYRDLLVKRGCDGRQADMFSALLAGRSLLLDDDKPREEPELFDALSKRLGNIFLEDSESGDGKLCLHHLYDATCDAIRDGRRLTIGQVIAKERKGSSTFDSVLDSYGLRLMPDGSLFVPFKHGQLDRVYGNTPWALGGWRHSLKRLPGVEQAQWPVRVSGIKIRGLFIPHDLLPSLESDADPPQPPGGANYPAF